MIVVNLKKSVGRLLSDIGKGIPDDVVSDQIREVTRGDWGGLSADALVTYGDYIAAAYETHIVAIYRIATVSPVATSTPSDRVAFSVTPAPEFIHLVGAPVPNGAWKRGEARPVRYVLTEGVEAFLAEQGIEPMDIPEDRAWQVTNEVIVKTLRSLAPKPVSAEAPLLDQVEVEKDPRGGIIVTVPIGTKVTLVQRPKG